MSSTLPGTIQDNHSSNPYGNNARRESITENKNQNRQFDISKKPSYQSTHYKPSNTNSGYKPFNKMGTPMMPNQGMPYQQQPPPQQQSGYVSTNQFGYNYVHPQHGYNGQFSQAPVGNQPYYPPQNSFVPPVQSPQPVPIEMAVPLNWKLKIDIKKLKPMGMKFPILVGCGSSELTTRIVINSKEKIDDLQHLLKEIDNRKLIKTSDESTTKTNDLKNKHTNLSKQLEDSSSKLLEMEKKLAELEKEELKLEELLKEEEVLLLQKKEAEAIKEKEANDTKTWADFAIEKKKNNDGKPISTVLDTSKTGKENASIEAVSSPSANKEKIQDKKTKVVSKQTSTGNKTDPKVKHANTSASPVLSSSTEQPNESISSPLNSLSDNGNFIADEDFGSSVADFLLNYMIKKPKKYTFVEEKLKNFNPPQLANGTNICFMNSILQTLLAIPDLINLLYGLSRCKDFEFENLPVSYYLWHFLAQSFEFSNKYKGLNNQPVLGEEGNKTLDASVLFDQINSLKHFTSLQKGRQEDAEEFLTQVLDSLHEEYIECIEKMSYDSVQTYIKENAQLEQDTLTYLSNFINKKNCKWINDSSLGDSLKKRIETNEENNAGWETATSVKQEVRHTEYCPTPVTEIFGWSMKSEVRKTKDIYKKGEFPVSITYDPHLVIPLDLHKKNSEINYNLQTMYLNLSKEEDIKIDNHLAKKFNKFHTLPKVLIVQLKRFQYNLHQEKSKNSALDEYKNDNSNLPTGKSEKLKDVVEFDLTLNIPDECLEDPKATKSDYTLKSIVYHSGSDTQSGHYTVDVINNKKQWFRCNDTKIETLTKKDVLELGKKKVYTPYILVYTRDE
ncbi:hypothetical protein ACO0SA_004074 [Hanseniaspora valbyensis]